MLPLPAPDAAPTPGRFTLPSLLLRTVRVWGRHLLAFTVVGLVLDLPIAAVQLRGTLTEENVAGIVLSFFLLWCVRIVGTAALSLGVLESLAGDRPTIRRMLATPARQLWPIFAVAAAYSALVILGFSLILPGVFVFVAGYLAIPAVVAEPDMGTEAALRRSFVLTQGHRLQLLVAFVVLYGLEQLGSEAVGWMIKGPLASSRLAGVALNLGVDALLCGLTSCSFAVAYHDLRLTKGLLAPRIRSVPRS
jgi:hypothetical protein